MITLRPNQTFIYETKFRSLLYTNKASTTDKPGLEKIKVFVKTFFANLIELPIAALSSVVALIESIFKTVINGLGYFFSENCENQFGPSVESMGVSIGYLLTFPFFALYRIMHVWGRALSYKVDTTSSEKNEIKLRVCLGIDCYGKALEKWAVAASGSDRAPQISELFQLLILLT